jgi:uncharacterized DUF497 family protein
MQYEYDPDKSAANKAKHGIDFEEAKLLWSDEFAIEQAARSDAEPRFIIIGRIGDNMWSAFVTYRGALTRIISVRRARRQEIEDYEQEITRRRT